MLEREQGYPIENPRRPYCWNSSSRRKSRESELPAAGSSQSLSTETSVVTYRCNNCNVEAPIDELRVRESEQGQLDYNRRSQRPVLYHEMHLCHGCNRTWLERMSDSTKYSEQL